MDQHANYTCPFCKEKDFGKMGLKYHIISGQCGSYEKIPLVQFLGVAIKGEVNE
jgi:hypothetical protein